MARTPQDPQIRINEILDAADQLFFTKGYQATTISDIAKKMGVAQGMLYYYFKSKEAVLETLLDRHASSLISEIQNIICLNNSPSEKIALTISTTLHKASYKDGLLLNMLYDTQNLHLKVQLFRQLELAFSPWLLKIIEEGIAKQDFCVSHPPTAVDYILVIVDFLSEALYQKTSADILSFRLKMAEELIEKALGAQEKTIHILL
ncbi:AcrR family transcriptional regulator [Sporomusaceae bacterium BoRhaA]|uniref:TetR/AcrR family transcriptional regulator n=1 Tax=Pelorhabdus rhamnosifermentans TaxID=2772457 RepID=UPI001C06023A|nr:TetR/AcrR family transcriptional regulator [Pelorhabdus rhamnosifermentans]MBU2703268.1 AcrR family transcriptional regulator [Pelorhabdus rhamnosifermentans]